MDPNVGQDEGSHGLDQGQGEGVVRLPQLRRVALADFQLVFSEDLSDHVYGPNDSLRPALQSAIEDALLPLGTGLYRRNVDVDGAILSLVIDVSGRELALGSLDFFSERVLAYALDSTGTSSDLADAFTDHIQRFLDSSCAEGPSEIERVTARHGLVDLIADHSEGATDESLASVEATAGRHGRSLLGRIESYSPRFMERLTQLGFDLAADYPAFRIHMLRFVAMLPSLDFDEEGVEVKRLLMETVRRTLDSGRRLPLALICSLWMIRCVAYCVPARLLARITRATVRRFARMLIAGETIGEAQRTLASLAKTGRSATLDQLGELVVSEPEADTYLERVLGLIRGFDADANSGCNSAGIPTANVSIKLSALCAHFEPDDPDGTYAAVAPRLKKILEAAQAHQVYINLDAEHYEVRDLNFTVLCRVLTSNPTLKEYPHLGIAVQAYLRDAAEHLDDIIRFSRERGVRMPIRLVKGAYWDQETIEAEAHGFDAPQFLNKVESDLHFQQLCIRILEHPDEVQLCLGSHNLRDHCFARAAREVLYPESPPIEHQVLHMTSEGLAIAMAERGWAVRNYIPVGSLLVGMAYLVRRIMENSSQAGVLTQARRGLDPDRILMRPGERYRRKRAKPTWRMHAAVRSKTSDLPRFRNVAPVRLYRPMHREALAAEINHPGAMTRLDLATDRRNGTQIDSVSPSDNSVVVGTVTQANQADTDAMLEKAFQASTHWEEQGAGGRAAALIRAADLLLARRIEAAVLVAEEAGKNRAEALADIDESIDFLRFYALEALRLAAEDRADAPRAPRGVLGVVAPWNFPLAIPCGMTSAALVAGNTVLLKSAKYSPLIAEYLVSLLHEAGVPQDVLQHALGPGREVGARILASERVAGCVFTGSKEVGVGIYESLSRRIPPSGSGACRVIVEMGGKNAIIVTASADLDEAMSGCLYSAFGHAGQKCSAASRILVDERIYDRFTARFIRAVMDLKIGPALEPGVDVNPVISEFEADRLKEVARQSEEECLRVGGRVLLNRSQEGQDRPGNIVGPSVFELPIEAVSDPESFGQREIFGPVVHLIPYRGLEQAVEVFNGTPFALTGGVFSQSQDDIDQLSSELNCGNIYVNRSITGARVSIEPFGGYWHSGTGPKAGGRSYVSTLRPQRASSAVENRIAWNPPESKPWIHLPGPRPDIHSASTASSVATTIRSVGEGVFAQPQLLLDYAQWVTWDLRHHLAGSTPNRRVPGQDSYDRTSLSRGSVLVLAAEAKLPTQTAVHALSALTTGNRVTVLAMTDDSARAWRSLKSVLDRYQAVSGALIITDTSVGLDPADYATCVADGPLESYSECIDTLFGGVEPGRDLCAFQSLSEGPYPPDWWAITRCHLYTRSFAVNTLRHGAPLSLD
ncbi:MAG: hypothetical protein CMH54_00805 [Myxococcales bacterium]|nr:hypothetical protein [Myxococcales bacterium]